MLLLQSGSLMAQDGDIYISVAMPGNGTLDSNTKSILKNKLLSIVSAQGVAGTEYGAIIIVPEVNVTNSSTVEGGMRRIISVDMEITVTIRNMITNTVFSTIQMESSGEGYSYKEAERSAIGKINASSPEYISFVKMAKSRIIKYYETNTTTLVAKANTMASQEQYDEALALLSAYPESLSGYQKVSKAMIEIFSKCQTQYCSQILMSAQAAYSRQDYEEAAELASMVDSQSSCAPQAKSLLSSIKSSLNKEYADAIEMEKEKMMSDERIKTAQINAIRDIASAYFKRQTEFVFFW